MASGRWQGRFVRFVLFFCYLSNEKTPLIYLFRTTRGDKMVGISFFWLFHPMFFLFKGEEDVHWMMFPNSSSRCEAKSGQHRVGDAEKSYGNPIILKVHP